MTVKYLKKAIKNASTDDAKTRITVQNILNDIEKTREKVIKKNNRNNLIIFRFIPVKVSKILRKKKIDVGVAGFEPATSASQTRRDNRATLHPENEVCKFIKENSSKTMVMSKNIIQNKIFIIIY